MPLKTNQLTNQPKKKKYSKKNRGVKKFHDVFFELKLKLFCCDFAEKLLKYLES